MMQHNLQIDETAMSKSYSNSGSESLFLDTRPNFFILGAPKCGTTSLSDWLGQHDDIFISKPKEPKFFNTDWELPNRPSTENEYARLFAEAQGCLAVGEATTGYLSSKVAVEKILDYSPTARFIVCLRDPIEMLVSLHGQRLKEGIENDIDLESAWRKQAFRRQGKEVPRNCTDAKTLLYGSICLLGEQVERLLSQVESDRVCFVLLEDIKNNPELEYRRVLDYLDMKDDARTDFPVKNKGSLPKILWLTQLSRALGRLKKKIGIRQNFGLQKWFLSFNKKSKPVSDMDNIFRTELIEYFKPDVELLSRLIEKDLSHWLQLN